MVEGLNVSALERCARCSQLHHQLLSTMLTCHSHACPCRCIVVQQRSAIAVEDPLGLSAFLERLAGLGDMEACIATKTAKMQVAMQQCEAHAAESERCGVLDR